MRVLFNNFVAAEFPKTPSPKPARIPSQTPPAGGGCETRTREGLLPHAFQACAIAARRTLRGFFYITLRAVLLAY